MRYLAKSAEVLNEADRFQKILDWELFTTEQEVQLWYSNLGDGGWRPGDYLYNHPRYDGCDCGFCVAQGIMSGAMPQNSDYEGNIPRPMIQELKTFPDAYPFTCRDCEVDWDRYQESACFVCGKEYGLKEKLIPKKIFGTNFDGDTPMRHFPDERFMEIFRVANAAWQSAFQDLSINTASLRTATQQLQTYAMTDFTRMMRQSSRRAGRSMRAAYLDEWRDSQPYSWMPNPPAPFVPFRGVSFHNPWIDPPHPLMRPNIRGPVWGTAALYDPMLSKPGMIFRSRLNLPKNWRKMRTEIPLPEMPPVRDFSNSGPVYYQRLRLDGRRR